MQVSSAGLKRLNVYTTEISPSFPFFSFHPFFLLPIGRYDHFVLNCPYEQSVYWAKAQTFSVELRSCQGEKGAQTEFPKQEQKKNIEKTIVAKCIKEKVNTKLLWPYALHYVHSINKGEEQRRRRRRRGNLFFPPCLPLPFFRTKKPPRGRGIEKTLHWVPCFCDWREEGFENKMKNQNDNRLFLGNNTSWSAGTEQGETTQSCLSVPLVGVAMF